MSTIQKLETKVQLSTLAKLLLLVGGVLLLIGGLLQIADIRNTFDLTPGIRSFASLSSLTSGILALLVGMLALIGSRKVWSPAWNIVLLILGLVVSGLGGVLVFVASIIGLVETYIKN